MTLDEAINEAENYIVKLEDIVRWVNDAPTDVLQETGEVTIDEYKELIRDWEMSEGWDVIYQKTDHSWNHYQGMYRSYTDKIKSLNKAVEKANEPMTRWDIALERADEAWDSRHD